MRVIIAGSRGIDSYEVVKQAISDSGFDITELVTGKAKLGVDPLGERWAEENGIPVTSFYAKWKKQGKAAGKIRNSKMARYSAALIAVWDGQSPGTADMIAKAKYRGLKVYIHNTSVTSE